MATTNTNIRTIFIYLWHKTLKFIYLLIAPLCMYVCMYVCMYCCGVRVVEGDHNAEGSFHMVMIR